MAERAQERRPERQDRPQDQDDALGPEDVDQDEPGEERAEDAADHAPGVDLADRRPGAVEPPQPVDRQLGDHRADRPQRQRGEEEDDRHDEQDPVRPGQRDVRRRPAGVRLVQRGGLHQHRLRAAPCRRTCRATHWGGVSSTRIDRVRIDATRNSQLACFSLLMKSAILPPRKLPRLRPAEQHADDARPAVDARAQVPRDQPAGDHLQRHEHQAGEEGQHGQVRRGRCGRRSAPLLLRRDVAAAGASSSAGSASCGRRAETSPATAATATRTATTLPGQREVIDPDTGRASTAPGPICSTSGGDRAQPEQDGGQQGGDPRRHAGHQGRGQQRQRRGDQERDGRDRAELDMQHEPAEKSRRSSRRRPRNTRRRWRCRPSAACSTAILATTGPIIPSTVAGIRKSIRTTRTVRSSQFICVGAGQDAADLGVDPERAERQEGPEGEQRPDRPARLDPVAQPSPQHVAQADPAQDDADHARPDRQRRADVPRDQPARHQLQDHDAQAAGERQGIRQQSGEN